MTTPSSALGGKSMSYCLMILTMAASLAAAPASPVEMDQAALTLGLLGILTKWNA